MKTKDQPKRIRALGQYYTIKGVEQIDEEDNTIAEVDPVKRMIKYQLGTDEEVLKEAIFHEVVHLGERLLALDPTEYIDECQVVRVSHIVFSILRDNPTLANWLLEEENWL